MFQFTSDIDASALTGLLSRIPGALAANRDPMRSAVMGAMAEVMRFEQRRFRQASGSPGNPWAGLSIVTKKRRAERQLSELSGGKRRKLPPGVAGGEFFPILSDTGALERGLFERGAPGHFVSIDADSIREGAGDGAHPRFKGTIGQLSVIHHNGTPLIPARPVMADPDSGTLDAVGSALAAGVGAVFDSLAAGIGGEPGSMKVAA